MFRASHINYHFKYPVDKLDYKMRNEGFKEIVLYPAESENYLSFLGLFHGKCLFNLARYLDQDNGYNFKNDDPYEKLILSIKFNKYDEFVEQVESGICMDNFIKGLPLTLCIIHNRPIMLQYLIERSVNYHYWDIFIAIYCYKDDLSIIKLLLEYSGGKILNIKDEYRNEYLPIIFACSKGDLRIIKLFYDYLPYTTETQFAYECGLVCACMMGHLDVIYFLEDIGTNLHVFNNELIAIASYNMHINIVKYLLEKGLDVHACQDKAIIAACIQGETKIVKLLLDCGANPRTMDDTAITRAIFDNHIEVVKLLIKYDNELFYSLNDNIIRMTFSYNLFNIIKYFIEIDFSFNNNCLWKYSILFNRINFVEILISLGVDIYWDNNFAIKTACSKGYLDIVKKLFEIDPNFVMMKNELLQIANTTNEMNIVEYLNSF